MANDNWALRATFAAGWHMEFEASRAVDGTVAAVSRVLDGSERVTQAFRMRLSPAEYARAVELLAGSLRGARDLCSVTIHTQKDKYYDSLCDSLNFLSISAHSKT